MHDPDLHRRRVRAQQQAPGALLVDSGGHVEVERVVQVHRRVIGGEIEGKEVVPVGLDLRAQGDGEAQPPEDLRDFIDDRRDGMYRPDPSAPRGHGEVDGAPLRLGPGLVKFRPPRRDCRFGAQLEGVDGGAERAPLLGRARGQRLERRRDLAGLPAHERDFLALEGSLVETREGRDARQQGVEFRITGGVSHGQVWPDE